MLFEEKKLTSDSIDELLHCPIQTVEPYALMLAPVYILMKLNQKLVSVKAPLDFFTPDELERLERYETFYLPQFARLSARFQTAARLTKSILTAMNDGVHAIAPFEISSEIYHCLYGLWGKEERVEPFFMSIFADELCTPLDPLLLVKARESTVVLHDLGLILSGTFVFLALQMKVFQYDDISRIRTEIYTRTVGGEKWENPKSEDETMIQALYQIVTVEKEINRKLLAQVQYEWARKLCSRMDRYSKNRKGQNFHSPSIFGPEGFTA